MIGFKEGACRAVYQQTMLTRILLGAKNDSIGVYRFYIVSRPNSSNFPDTVLGHVSLEWGYQSERIVIL
jgi:hypothetical protein